MSRDQIEPSLRQLYMDYSESFKGEEIVLGEGCLTSPLVIIGEAPGKDEVKQGKPFVGAAGQNLNEFIDILGIGREALYITNAIKYRLGKRSPKTQRIVNRPATIDDISKNQSWLHQEIKILKPKIIVTLGNVPLRAVVQDYRASIGNMHGTCHGCQIYQKEFELFPLYHPASIIYNRGLKEVYNEDMLTLKEKVKTFFK